MGIKWEILLETPSRSENKSFLVAIIMENDMWKFLWAAINDGEDKTSRRLIPKELEYVLADIKELEWKAKHGYRYNQNAFLNLRGQHRLLSTKLKALVIKDVKHIMKDHKRDIDTLIDQISKDLTKHQENETKDEIQEFHNLILLESEKLTKKED